MTQSGFVAPVVFKTVMYCADCGAVLDHCKGVPISEQARAVIASPIYQHKVLVAIRPCRSCIEKEIGPARDLKNALAAIAKGPKQ